MWHKFPGGELPVVVQELFDALILRLDSALLDLAFLLLLRYWTQSTQRFGNFFAVIFYLIRPCLPIFVVVALHLFCNYFGNIRKNY